MRGTAIFFNGMFERPLQDILAVQLHLPEQILFMQPYSSKTIRYLVGKPPGVDDPVRLLASVTDDLPTVHYVGEIVGWDDKRELSDARLHVLNRVIYLLQPSEGGVYATARQGVACANLLHVRRLRQLSRPFLVGKLVKTSDGQPVSVKRTTAGGWTYVVNPSDEWIEQYL